MDKFDLAIAYTWEYDEDFVHLIEEMCHDAGISTFLILPHNVHEVTDLLKKHAIRFGYYLDRASDVHKDFFEAAQILSRRNTYIFNPYKNVSHAIDKASMHLEFITGGINVPYSIIVPPFCEKEEIYISLDDLTILGRPFIIKPCNNTGGGIGVVTGAESLKEVLEERCKYHEDKYLIQEKIYPMMFDSRRAWFRCFYAFGKVIPTWWDDQTHLYNEVTLEEVSYYYLKELFSLTRKIARLTELDFFSTEIVYSTREKFVVVDYVNDQCDMRIKSLHLDGVPDNVVRQIIQNMIRFMKRNGF